MNKQNIKYGSGIDYSGKIQSLYLDIYSNPLSSTKLQPTLIFLVGGSFLTCEYQKFNENKKLLELFLKHGWRVIVPQYRVLKDRPMVSKQWKKTSDYLEFLVQHVYTDSKLESLQKMESGQIGCCYSSVRDIRMCLRFLQLHSKKFNIDTQKVCLMGFSAGAYISSILSMILYQKKNNNMFLYDDRTYFKKDTFLHKISFVNELPIQQFIHINGSPKLIDIYKMAFKYNLYKLDENYKNKSIFIHSQEDEYVSKYDSLFHNFKYHIQKKQTSTLYILPIYTHFILQDKIYIELIKKIIFHL